jgi:hypothetical protein
MPQRDESTEHATSVANQNEGGAEVSLEVQHLRVTTIMLLDNSEVISARSVIPAWVFFGISLSCFAERLTISKVTSCGAHA